MTFTHLPSLSTPDSLDWKDTPASEMAESVIEKTKSGSILLFHNDLANTTEALPVILTALRDKGYEFVKVSDLIYWDNYTIDSNGMQTAVSKSSLELTPENVEAVMAQYSDEIAAAGFSEEQLAQAAEAIKNGAELPDEVMAVIAELDVPIAVSAAVNTESSPKNEPQKK